MYYKLPVFFFFLFLLSAAIHSQPTRIFMDGVFSDWQQLSPIHVDPLGDQQIGDIDFGELSVTNDGDYLFVRIQIGADLNMQDNNQITLYLDTDDNSATGNSIHGIGAELEWVFGFRSGAFIHQSGSNNIRHVNIGLVSSPTVTSTEFEIAIERDAQPNGQSPLFPEAVIRIVFEDQGPGSDVLPNASGGVAYSFSNDPLPPIRQIAIAKQDTNTIRFLSYNVLSDGIFDPSRIPSFMRLLQAIQPKIIGFQEIYDHNAQETISAVEAMLPSSGQEQWYGEKIGLDILAISRFPILNAFPIQGYYGPEGNGAFLIDLQPKFNSQLLLIVAHPPCCDNNEERQYEVDAIMAFIREAKQPGGVLTLPQDTPIMIVGDMNLVGAAQQLTTLLTGEIVNTNPFGPSFSPDWDGSDFGDLLARSTNQPMFYTWFNPNSSFSPGRLDFMIYSNSVLESTHKFVLFTPSLSGDTLSAYNLQAQDATIASDHLPVVSDFRLSNITGIRHGESSFPEGFVLHQNYPNPFNPTTSITFDLPRNTSVELKIFDIQGRLVRTLVNNQLPAGRHRVTWDGRNDNGSQVSSGMYLYRLEAGQFQQVHKTMLLR